MLRSLYTMLDQGGKAHFSLWANLRANTVWIQVEVEGEGGRMKVEAGQQHCSCIKK